MRVISSILFATMVMSGFAYGQDTTQVKDEFVKPYAKVVTWSGYNKTDGTTVLSNRFTLASRVGFNFTVDSFKGKFELGLEDYDGTTKDRAYVRLGYAVWNFGMGKLLIGKTYTPYYSGIGAVANANPLWTTKIYSQSNPK